MLSNKNIIVLSILIVLSLLSVNLMVLGNIYASTESIGNMTSEKSIPVYMITTRGNLNMPQGVQEFGYNDKYQFGDINQLKNECPDEIAIFVHGWHNDKLKAEERLDRVKMSLEKNNYIIPLIGLSWDSDKEWNPAKIIAKKNGPKLANFIIDYVNTCKEQHNKDVNIRLISHSLGARLLLSTLDSLNTNPTWNNNNYKITSVHLMGAAVDADEVSKNSLITNNDPVKDAYGNAIQEQVLRLYNLYNPEDNILQFVYPKFDGIALGNSGRDQDIKEIDKVSTPPYFDINVRSEIPAISNADAMEDKHFVFCGIIICDSINSKGWDMGLCLPFYFGTFLNKNCAVGIGDNHGGYIGFRAPTNKNLLEDDGAMNIVVENWRNPEN